MTEIDPLEITILIIVLIQAVFVMYMGIKIITHLFNQICEQINLLKTLRKKDKNASKNTN